VFRLTPGRPLATAIPIYGWACANIGVMVLTVFAAPIMLSVPGLGNDPIALARAFAGFAYWDGVRAVVGAVGDCAALWALVALLRPHAEAA
jgi:hypothetical protein